MPLYLYELIPWIIVTLAFIATITVLYGKVSKAKKTDDDKDEATAY